MKNTNSNNSRKFRLTSEEKFLVLIVLSVLIGLLVRGYGNWLIEKTTKEVSIEVAETTREQVIESAKLEEVYLNGYTISFDGESHKYSWD